MMLTVKILAIWVTVAIPTAFLVAGFIKVGGKR